MTPNNNHEVIAMLQKVYFVWHSISFGMVGTSALCLVYASMDMVPRVHISLINSRTSQYNESYVSE